MDPFLIPRLLPLSRGQVRELGARSRIPRTNHLMTGQDCFRLADPLPGTLRRAGRLPSGPL